MRHQNDAPPSSNSSLMPTSPPPLVSHHLVYPPSLPTFTLSSILAHTHQTNASNNFKLVRMTNPLKASNEDCTNSRQEMTTLNKNCNNNSNNTNLKNDFDISSIRCLTPKELEENSIDSSDSHLTDPENESCRVVACFYAQQESQKKESSALSIKRIKSRYYENKRKRTKIVGDGTTNVSDIKELIEPTVISSSEEEEEEDSNQSFELNNRTTTTTTTKITETTSITSKNDKMTTTSIKLTSIRTTPLDVLSAAERQAVQSDDNELQATNDRWRAAMSLDRHDYMNEAQLDRLNSLIKIIRSGNYNEFLELLERRGFKQLLNVFVEGHTALHYTLIYGRSLAWCRQLVQNGANPNLSNRAGWHPIHLAAFNGSRETMRYLIDCIAN